MKSTIIQSVLLGSSVYWLCCSPLQAAICMEPGKYDPDHTLKVSNIWKEVTTKTKYEYTSISTCMAAPEDICQVLAPLNWHAGEGERQHYTWRIGKNQNEPTAITLHTVHIYSTNENKEKPYDHEGWATGFKEFPCN